jgi:transformation/transcription domain-associated protein
MEGRAVKALLSRLGKSYPQALYFSLRAFYLERRDVERSRGPTPVGGNHQSASVAFSEELMSLLRRSQAALWSSLEAILEELIVKFKPSFDEELLVYIAGILERAESHADRKSLKTSESSDEDAVLASITKNISRISAKFFHPPSPDSSSSRRDERSKKTAEFTRKYKDLFEADFQLNAAESIDETLPENEKLELSDFLDRLKKWRRLLEDQVSSTPSSLPLIGSSPALALFASEAPDLWAGSCDPLHADAPSTDRQRNADSDGGNPSTASSSYVAATTAAAVAAQAVAKTAFSEGNGGDFGGGSTVIEIPGQYFPNRTSSQDSRPCPELHAKLLRFDSTVRIVRRNEQLIRKIGMVGSDGKTYHFSLQWALPYWTRTEERTAQLFYLMDRILRRGILSSRNSLSVQPTGVVPIAQRLRITSEESTRVTLEDVFRLWCEKRGTSFDAASKCFHDEFLKRLEEDKTSDMDDDAKARTEEVARLHALTKVRGTRVQANLLLEYMHEKLDGPEQLFQFRRNFAGQLSADALIQHAFCVVERNPSRTAFLERNGQVLSPDYRFEYNNHGECPLRPVCLVG